MSYSRYRSTASPIATAVSKLAAAATTRPSMIASGKTWTTTTAVNRSGTVARNHLSCWRTSYPARCHRSATLASTATAAARPHASPRWRITPNSGP